MTTKCDSELIWWIDLANLHKTELVHVTDLNSASKGFADKARKLKGPPPEAVDILLGGDAELHRNFVRVGNDPDKSIWGLAGVTNAVLSEMASPHESRKPPYNVVVADWSGFIAPLILSVSATGVITDAERFEPLARLLALLRERNISSIGCCPVCGMLFERLRRDQACDTTRCRDVHRQRRKRRTQRKGRALSKQRRKALNGMPYAVNR
jgi:hypothetical protein